MKRMISAIILLIITICIYASGCFVVNGIYDSEKEKLETSIRLIKEGNVSKAITVMEKKSNLLRATHYIHKDNIYEIENANKLIVFYLYENNKSEAIINAKRSLDYLSEVKKAFSISLDSFF